MQTVYTSAFVVAVFLFSLIIVDASLSDVKDELEEAKIKYQEASNRAQDEVFAAAIGKRYIGKVRSVCEDCYERLEAHIESKAECKNFRKYEAIGLFSVECEESDRQGVLKFMKDSDSVSSASIDTLISLDKEELYTKEEIEAANANVDIAADYNTVYDDYNWGHDWIDGNMNKKVKEYLPRFPNEGAGTQLYVVDTGCYVDHKDFKHTQVTSIKAPGTFYADGNNDGQGHGTHCAGSAVGTMGIAPKAELICIKALNDVGTGAVSDVISGINYVVEQKKKNPNIPMVMNLSLTTKKNKIMNAAINSAVSAGVRCIVAAGNYGKKAQKYSPASTASAIVVCAHDKNGNYASFSNYHKKLVDICAPGVDIVSTGHLSRTSRRKLSGTSMAAPMVAGAFLLYEAEALANYGKSCLTSDKNLYYAKGSESIYKSKSIQPKALTLDKVIGYPTSC